MRPGTTSLAARLAPPLAIVLTIVVALAAAIYPLTGTLGWESAQILGASLGPMMLVVGAIRGAAQRERGFLGDFGVQAATAAVAILAYVGILAFAGLSHESCAPSRGLLPFVFFSLPVITLHCALGPWIGRLIGRERLAIAAAVVVLAGLIFWLFLTWMWAPSFRVISHFFVVIDGDLLAGRSIASATVAFRFATLLFATALIFAGMWRFPQKTRTGLSSGTSGGSGAALIAALVFVLVGATAHFQATAAIAPSRAEMEAAYSLQRTRGDLVVRADPLVHNVREVEGILAEGSLWLSRLSARMGVAPSAPITIWLHKDRPTLGKWTGAEHVHFALPGARELHITHAEVPHRSLGHELAHVLGREISSSFLGVPTKFVLLVNAGITEGLAMAVTPEIEVRRELTLDQEAAALRRANLAPDLRALFHDNLSSLRFWQEPPGRAYVTAGALMNALRAEKGVEGLAKVYREARLGAAFASDEELETFLTAHEKRLDSLELPPDAIGAVTRRHGQVSILNQTCNREKILAANEIRAKAFSGEFDAAEKIAVAVEGKLLPETLELFATAASRQHLDAQELDAWVRRAATPAGDDVRGANERMDDAADALWRANRRRQATAYWGRTQVDALSPGRARAVLAKRLLAAELDARGGLAPVSDAAMLLLTDDASDRDNRLTQVANLANALASSTRESPAAVGTARYILARQYAQHGMPSEAVVDFLSVWDQAGSLLPPPLAEQILVGLAVSHARRGDLALASTGFAMIAERTKRADMRVRMRDYEERAKLAATSSEPADALLLGLDGDGGY